MSTPNILAAQNYLRLCPCVCHHPANGTHAVLPQFCPASDRLTEPEDNDD